MIYRLVVTPKFMKHWFANGLDRDSLEKAPAVFPYNLVRLGADF